MMAKFFYLNAKSEVLKNIDLVCSFKLVSNIIRNKKQVWYKQGVVHLHTSWMTVIMYFVPHSGWLPRLRPNYLSGFFMANTNIM